MTCSDPNPLPVTASMDGLRARVRQLMQDSDLTEIRLSKHLGIEPYTMRSRLSRSFFKEFELVRLLKIWPDLNLHWLLTGVGPERMPDPEIMESARQRVSRLNGQK